MVRKKSEVGERKKIWFLNIVIIFLLLLVVGFATGWFGKYQFVKLAPDGGEECKGATATWSYDTEPEVLDGKDDTSDGSVYKLVQAGKAFEASCKGAGGEKLQEFAEKEGLEETINLACHNACEKGNTAVCMAGSHEEPTVRANAYPDPEYFITEGLYFTVESEAGEDNPFTSYLKGSKDSMDPLSVGCSITVEVECECVGAVKIERILGSVPPTDISPEGGSPTEPVVIGEGDGPIEEGISGTCVPRGQECPSDALGQLTPTGECNLGNGEMGTLCT